MSSRGEGARGERASRRGAGREAPPRQDEAPRLGTLESRVMDLLWDAGPSTIRGLIERLPGEPAYTTIATVLTNLHRKALVSPHKEGRSTVYGATGTREQHVASVMTHALGSSRDRAASILHFAETIPDDELDLLREFLDRRGGGAS